MKLAAIRIISAGLLAFAAAAHATPVSVSFSSASVGPLVLNGDTFTESGLSGSLSLDTDIGSTATQAVNAANLNVQFGSNGSAPLNIGFDLTLDGVTHTLAQSATLTITAVLDTLLAFEESTDVLFVTSAGRWLVHLNAFTINANNVGNFGAVVTADFTAVPEPATLALVGMSLMAFGAVRRIKRN